MRARPLMAPLVALFAAIAITSCDLTALLFNDDPADPDGSGGNGDAISQDISVDTTWESGSTYRVAGLVEVRDGATLTIQEGTNIEFESDAGLSIANDGSALVATGSASNPILMTGTEEQAGFWKGVGIYSSNAQNEMTYVEVAYAGSDTWSITGTDTAAAILLETGASLTLANSTVRNSGALGLYGNGGADLSGFTGNTFTDNADAPVRVSAPAAGYLDGASSFANNVGGYVEIYGQDVTASMTLAALEDDVPYRFSGSTRVGGGAQLTVSSGVEMEFTADAGIAVEDNASSLVAAGTAADPITMTGSQTQDGWWKGIGFYSTNQSNELAHVELAHAGSSTWSITGTDRAAAILLEGGSRLTLTNSTVRNSGAYGLFGNGNTDLSGFATNTFENNADAPVRLSAPAAGYIDGASDFSNNSNAYVAVYDLSITADTSLAALVNNVPYRFSGVTDVEGDATLTLQDGVEVEFSSDAGIDISVNTAAFVADGTSGDGILLTGSQAQSGWWRGIALYSSNTTNRMHYVTVDYAGSTTTSVAGTDPNAAIVLDEGAVLDLNNSTVQNSGGWGVWINSASETLTESGNTYSGNAGGNVRQP